VGIFINLWGLTLKTLFLFILAVILPFYVYTVDAGIADLDVTSDILLNQVIHIDYGCPSWATSCQLKIVLPSGATVVLVDNIPPTGGGTLDYQPQESGAYSVDLVADGSFVTAQKRFTVGALSLQDITNLQSNVAILTAEVNALQQQQSFLFSELSSLKTLVKHIRRALFEVITCLSTQGTYPCTPPPPPTPPLPVLGYWKFDEGSGAIVFDSSTHGNNGTIQGNWQWTTDSQSGYALDFNGVDTRIFLGNPFSLKNMSREVQLEAWVKRQSSQDGMIISRNGPYYLAIRNNKVEGGVFFGSWNQITGTTLLNQNQWYHLMMHYNGTFINVYVDGVLDGAIPENRPIYIDDHVVYIGWGEPGHDQYFDGIMDEVKISGT